MNPLVIVVLLLWRAQQDPNPIENTNSILPCRTKIEFPCVMNVWNRWCCTFALKASVSDHSRLQLNNTNSVTVVMLIKASLQVHQTEIDWSVKMCGGESMYLLITYNYTHYNNKLAISMRLVHYMFTGWSQVYFGGKKIISYLCFQS